VSSELYAEEHHWGAEVIDLREHDLPALKASYLVGALGRAGRALEIGCGSGRILNTIAAHRPGLELHGCDIRPLRAGHAAFQFRQVDAQRPSLPYADDSFDTVILYDVLEHLTDPAATLAEAHRVSAAGGTLVSFTPLEGGHYSAYRMYRRILGDDLYLETKEHIQAFDFDSLSALVERDFRIVDEQFAYHFVGQLMDATLFALMKVPGVRRRFWNENPYYREAGSAKARVTAFEQLLRLANSIAYAESRALRHVRFGAAGVLFTAEAR
jgi:SAM-dependent methyltransferase